MKKNYRFRFLALAAILLLGVVSVSCHKDDDEITEERARIVMANAEVVMANVSKIYETSETVEEMAQHLDEIKAMPNVEDAYRDDIAICVKIKDGGIIMWCYYPEEVEDEKALDVDEMFRNISKGMASGKGGSLCEKKSICLLNAINRPWENGYEEVVTKCKKMLNWDTCIRKSEHVTPDTILKYLPDNGVTILVTHGCYCDGQHWLTTGQLYNDVKVHLPKLIERWGKDLNRLVACSDTLKVEDTKIVISETFLDLLITKKFPQNSIVYSAACQTFKGNNSLWLKLKGKGLGCMLGFDNTVRGSSAMNCCVAFMEEMIDGKTASEACETARSQISLRERFHGLKLLCYPENSNITLVETGQKACLSRYFPENISDVVQKIVFEYNSNVNTGDRLDSYDSKIPIYGNLNGTTYTISTSSSEIYAPRDCSSLFHTNYYSYCPNVSEIIFGDGFNTSDVTDMNRMFYRCENLTSLDLSGWNTSKVSDMSGMFMYCRKLTSLDLSGWNNSIVTNMSEMFKSTTSLTNLNLSDWNTSNVTDMSGMFSYCNLTNMNLSRWNTSNVTDMSNMFSGCSSLASLNLSGWNTSNVTDMGSMFSSCSSLSSLNLSGWNTSNVTTMFSMFEGCESLINLNISDWNTSNVTTMFSMFQDCSGLTSLNLSGWNTSNVETMGYMFLDCSGLTSLNLSGWNTSNVTNMQLMFRGCSRMIDLNIANFSLSGLRVHYCLATHDYEVGGYQMCYNLASISGACTITCTSDTQNRLLGLNRDIITWNIVGKK